MMLLGNTKQMGYHTLCKVVFPHTRHLGEIVLDFWMFLIKYHF